MKNFRYILSSSLLLLSCTSCGVFSKFAKHTKHEAHQVDSTSSTIFINNGFEIKGDSIVDIPGSSVQVIMPFTLDTLCANEFDSIVTDAVKVYLKPVYQVNNLGVKTLKGMQVKTVIPSQKIKSIFSVKQQSGINVQTKAFAVKDSTSNIKTLVKKRDNRLGGYATIIVILGVGCVCWWVVKKLKFKI